MNHESLASVAVIVTAWWWADIVQLQQGALPEETLSGLHAIVTVTKQIAAEDTSASHAMEALQRDPANFRLQGALREQLAPLLREEPRFQAELLQRILAAADVREENGVVRIEMQHPTDRARPPFTIELAFTDRLHPQITPAPARFIGRQSELERALDLLECGPGQVGTAVVTGAPGAGSTAFARLLAERLHARGVTGLQLEAQSGVTWEPATASGQPADRLLIVLRELLLKLGVAPGDMPADLAGVGGLLRNHVAGKRPLLLLEDADSIEGVMRFLPPDGLLIATMEEFPGGSDHEIAIEPLPRMESAILLRTRRPDPLPDSPVVSHFAALCGGVPLALSIIGRKLASESERGVQDLRNRLALAYTRRAENRTERSVFATLDICYPESHTPQYRTLRAAALLEAPYYNVWLLKDMLNEPIQTVRDSVHDLTRQGLLEPYGRSGDQWRIHPLVAAYALSAVEQAVAKRADIVERALRSYLKRAWAFWDLYRWAANHNDPALAAWARARLADDAPMLIRILKAYGPSLSETMQSLAKTLLERAHTWFGRVDAPGYGPTDPASEVIKPPEAPAVDTAETRPSRAEDQAREAGAEAGRQRERGEHPNDEDRPGSSWGGTNNPEDPPGPYRPDDPPEPDEMPGGQPAFPRRPSAAAGAEQQATKARETVPRIPDMDPAPAPRETPEPDGRGGPEGAPEPDPERASTGKRRRSRDAERERAPAQPGETAAERGGEGGRPTPYPVQKALEGMKGETSGPTTPPLFGDGRAAR